MKKHKKKGISGKDGRMCMNGETREEGGEKKEVVGIMGVREG